MKRKKKNKFFGKLTALALLCFLCCVFYHQYSSLKDYKNEISALKESIAEEKEHTKELDKTAEEYSTDEYVEKYARMLGLVKPNEKIFRNYSDKK